jgi:hypothetical protein
MFVRSATPHYRPLPSNNPGNPTMLAAIRRVSSRIISLVAGTDSRMRLRVSCPRAEHPNTEAWGRRKDVKVKVFGCSEDCARSGTGEG